MKIFDNIFNKQLQSLSLFLLAQAADKGSLLSGLVLTYQCTPTKVLRPVAKKKRTPWTLMQSLLWISVDHAWAMLDDFLSAMEALASKCPIDIYLIFDAHQNPRKMETSNQRRDVKKKAAQDLDSYIVSRDAYNEKKDSSSNS